MTVTIEVTLTGLRDDRDRINVVFENPIGIKPKALSRIYKAISRAHKRSVANFQVVKEDLPLEEDTTVEESKEIEKESISDGP